MIPANSKADWLANLVRSHRVKSLGLISVAPSLIDIYWVLVRDRPRGRLV
ncbi:MAG: hypothetical protein V7L31_08710 [Nostoc sp.]